MLDPAFHARAESLWYSFRGFRPRGTPDRKFRAQRNKGEPPKKRRERRGQNKKEQQKEGRLQTRLKHVQARQEGGVGGGRNRAPEKEAIKKSKAKEQPQNKGGRPTPCTGRDNRGSFFDASFSGVLLPT